MTVSLALAKQHLEYEEDDRDTLIAQYSAAAAAWVENFTGSLLERRQVTRIYPVVRGQIDLAIGPDVVVNTVTYRDDDGIEQPFTDYRQVGRRLIAQWPTADAFKVTMTAGYEETPADIVSAELLLIGHLFANRDAVITGTIATSIEFAVMALCNPHRLEMI